MSRSGGPQAQNGGWPQQRPAAAPEADVHASWSVPGQLPQGQWPTQPQQAFPGHPAAHQLQQQPGPAPAVDPYAQQSHGHYYQQAAPAPQPQQRAAPAYAPQQAQPAHQGHPANPQAPSYGAQPAAYNSYNYYQQPAAPAAYAPQPDYAAQDYAAQAARPDLRGPAYDQWPHAAPQQPAAQDVRGYDLSSYMPRSAPQAAPSVDYNQPSGQPSAGYGQPPEWVDANAAYAPHAHVPQLDAGNYGYQQPDYQAAEAGYSSAEAGHLEAPHEDAPDYEYEEEEPPRSGRKGMMIAATLVGAIFIGGGLAYSYKSFMGPTGDGPAPLVKSASGPAKVKPSDPGGKQFAHSDSKILGRLGENGSAADAAVDAGGARKVSTLVVGRDGSIQPPTAPTASSPPEAAVPGLTLVDITGGPPPAAAASPPAPPTPPPAAPQPVPAPVTTAASQPLIVNPPAVSPTETAPAPQKPVVIAKAQSVEPKVPTTTQSLNAAAAPEAPAAEAPKRPAVKKTAAVSPAPSGAGYVAVLASVPASGSSRMDALKQFADMQQKYGSALQSRTPDVQEANLGDKGRYHRLVVGPPGSRDAANTVCSQLKSQGYNDCWVMAY